MKKTAVAVSILNTKRTLKMKWQYVEKMYKGKKKVVEAVS